MPRVLSARLFGENACFTDALFRTERLSKPCPHPSQVRGILECILWKPEMQYLIHDIRILNDIRSMMMSKKELADKPSLNRIYSSVMSGGSPPSMDRIIRQTEILKDVAYEIRFEIVTRKGEPVKKYEEMFLRRLEKGQCKRTPFFGIMGFICDFGPMEKYEMPIPFTEDVGTMLLGRKFDNKGFPFQEVTFDAHIVDGILSVPLEKQREMIEWSWRES